MPATDDDPRVSSADHLQLWLVRMVEFLIGLLPLAVCHALGSAAGLVGWATMGRYRRLVTRNLRIAGGIDGNDPALPALVRRTFQLAGANMLCGMRTATMPMDKIRLHLEAQGCEHLARAGAEGHGVVAVIPHMGNWEFLAQATWLTVPEGMKVGTIYRPIDNPLLDALVKRRRASQGTATFSRTDGFHSVTSFLREGHMVGALSDQRAGHKGVLAPFFGRLASCSGLPELLARRTGAMLVSISVTTVGPGRWRIRYRPIEDTTTAGTMTALAEAMSDSLPDVFWFHDRWRVDSRRPLDFFVKRPKVQRFDQVTRPLRLLVSCRGLDPSAAAAVDELLAARPDARAEVLDDGSSHRFEWSERLRRIGFDSTAPPEHLAGFIKSLDREGTTRWTRRSCSTATAPWPRLRRIAGLRAIIGASATGAGDPWTHSEDPPPSDPDAWRELARRFGAVPLQTD